MGNVFGGSDVKKLSLCVVVLVIMLVSFCFAQTGNKKTQPKYGCSYTTAPTPASRAYTEDPQEITKLVNSWINDNPDYELVSFSADYDGRQDHLYKGVWIVYKPKESK